MRIGAHQVTSLRSSGAVVVELEQMWFRENPGTAITPPPPIPDAPVLVNVSSLPDGTLQIDVTDSSPGITRHTVYGDFGGGLFLVSVNVGPATTFVVPWTDVRNAIFFGGVLPSLIIIAVTSSNVTGESMPSNEEGPVELRFPTPLGMAANDNGDGTLNASCTDVAALPVLTTAYGLSVDGGATILGNNPGTGSFANVTTGDSPPTFNCCIAIVNGVDNTVLGNFSTIVAVDVTGP